VQWRAWPEGRTVDLEVLSELFSKDDPLVAKDASGRYYLESSRIEGTDGRPDDDAVEALVTLINGIARSKKHGFRPVNRGRYTAPDGVEHIVVKGGLEMAAYGLKASGGGPATPELVWGVLCMSVANQGPDVDEALRILSKSEPLGWGDMYKVWEIVREAVGGPKQVKRVGLATEDDLDRLKLSADHQKVSGDAARHARMEGDPRKGSGFSLDQGIAVVGTMVSRWVKSHST
jgi:hypothetical protein